MQNLMAFSVTGRIQMLLFCFYKHNVAFVRHFKGIDVLKETDLHD